MLFMNEGLAGEEGEENIREITKAISQEHAIFVLK